MGEVKEEKKMTYDELKNICGQLQQQNAFMREQLAKANTEMSFKMMEYAFKVLENDKFFDPEFVASISQEIQKSLAIPEEVSEKE
jgi:hypothetical protein